jgi:hypothetical protein
MSNLRRGRIRLWRKKSISKFRLNFFDKFLENPVEKEIQSAQKDGRAETNSNDEHGMV